MNIDTSKTAPIFTIGVGGAAGDGVREASVHAAEFAKQTGHHAFLAFYYPSLIRGGHNFGRVSYSADPIGADHERLDILISVNADSVAIRAPECAPDATVIVESAYLEEAQKHHPGSLGVPMNAVVKELNAPHAAAPSVGLGVLAYVFGLSREDFLVIAPLVFSDLVGGKDVNVALATKGYDFAGANGFPVRSSLRAIGATPVPGVLIEGNKAVAKGLLAAGLQFYVGYPMTPSTSILTYLAKEASQGRLKVVHPEDEISVMTMALGVAYTGTRAAIGTANGGFALMQEAFSFAGVSELPITAVVSQRQGPATGVATHTGQSDLRFVIHAGHGEFPRLVVAPGDVDECFETAACALNLSWKYQIPSIVLLDKHISESQGTTALDMETPRTEAFAEWIPELEPEYKRFRDTESGVSPLAFPGTPNVHAKATSYEHDEDGASVDHASHVLLMQNKRWRKLDGLRSEFSVYPTHKIFGDPTATTALVFWGSTKGAVLEAAKHLTTPIRFVQIIWMEPFDEVGVTQALAGATRVIVVEGNHGAQLAGLIREKTGILATDTITRYDSEPFEPSALAKDVRGLLGESA